MPKITQTSECLRACVQGGAVGTSNKPGLPNATGTLRSFRFIFTTATDGVFRVSGSANRVPCAEANSAYNTVDFSLDRANEIFGASDTVMPRSINTPLIIYLGR